MGAGDHSEQGAEMSDYSRYTDAQLERWIEDIRGLRSGHSPKDDFGRRSDMAAMQRELAARKAARATAAADHNALAPDLLARLIKGTTTEAERMVVLESLFLGVLLYHKHEGRAAGEILDSLTLAVSTRLARPKQ